MGYDVIYIHIYSILQWALIIYIYYLAMAFKCLIHIISQWALSLYIYYLAISFEFLIYIYDVAMGFDLIYILSCNGL